MTIKDRQYMAGDTKTSRTKIVIIKEPLAVIMEEEEKNATGESILSEEVIQEYEELKNKCEKIISKIKKRKLAPETIPI